MARLRFTLLGDFRAFRGDAALSVPGARLQGLAVRLALAGGRAVEPGVLVDAIWAEDPPADPAHALQALVSRLRRSLGSAADVAQVAGGYRLAVDPDDVDALLFERLCADAKASDPQAAKAAFGEAMALWDHRLGAITAVAPAVATRLAHVAAEATVDLADAELTLGRADAAAARLTALLTEQPAHERAAALLMDALTAQGRQAEALASYERIREALAEDLGVDPGTALRERHLRLLRAEAAPAVASNLPAPLTSFVGRDDGLARIDALLATGRLVTVLGPGGAGKTRLAVESARRHRGEYRDGAWMIDLASVTEPAKVGAAVLAAIGLRGTALFEAPGELPDELELLAGRESLLVMDNCEHLIDAVAHLVSALLVRCAGIRVLATSREPLAIDGEALVPLGPLTLPEPDTDLEQARQAASVRLFTERAAAVRPGFDVDEHNLAEVLRIVRSLDGLPLALELAAARLRTLSLGDLVAGLSDRFRLLTTGSRTAYPRHRTLRAVIAWSWDLLDADARTLAERISVLPGGVTPLSAAAVGAGDVRELLADLVDRSLLQLVPDTGRYRMLETIREYGLERLAEQDGLHAVRDLAAGYFADLVARLDPLLRGPEQLDALGALRAEYDNVIAALRHRCDTGDAIELAVNLVWYWHMLGRDNEAAYWLGEAIAPAEPGVARDVAEGLLLFTVTTHSTLAKERRDDVRALTARLLAQPALPGFGGTLAALRLASVEETEARFIQRLVDGPDGWLAGLARMFRAHSNENVGRLDSVRDDVAVALECFDRAGDRWGLATALPLRALLRQYDGDLAGALADLTEARRLAREFGSLSFSDLVFIDLRLIELHIRLGETARAAELITVTREHVRRSATPETAILLDAREAGLWLRLGDVDRARELIKSAEAGLSGQLAFDSDHWQALIGVVRAELCVRLGDASGAEKALVSTYAAAVDSGDLPIVATVAVSVAGLAALHGRDHDVAVILGAAARLRGAHDHTDTQVRALTLSSDEFAAAYETGWRLSAPDALTRVDPARLR